MQADRLQRAIGVISGTSMDGIDVALVETDGEARVKPLGGRTYPYEPALKADLTRLIATPDIALTDPLAELERAVTDAHVAAVKRFAQDSGVDLQGVDCIGLHGQTVLHRPERRFTRQLLDGGRAAAQLGRPVVFRFRHADVAAGGQGAPLVPLYHRALAAGLHHPIMVLNLGGVANVSYIDGDTVIAFDTGPASALIDDFMRRRRGVSFDADGALAASGVVDQGVLHALLDNPYFALPPPKSLDRNDFHRRAAIVDALGDADGAATLSAFTVESVAAALAHVPDQPRRWLVAGGGRLNRTLMAGLAARLGVPVEPVDSVGWDGDFTEAECFGYLAVRSRLGLPLSLPATTGVAHAMTGGETVHPAA
jgi:anhydro-N-acetylmuramic acid kinase